MKFLTTSIFLLLMSFASAHAALITIDTSVGANTGVLDTQSNLQWLKISATRGLSFNDVLSGMADSGRLADFRYGTAQEVQCSLLFVNLQMSCVTGQINQDVSTVQAFMDIFGILSGDSIIYGPIPPEQNPGVSQGAIETYMTQIVIRDITSNPVDLDTQLVTFSRDRPSVHWLVRNAQSVPEPATLALFSVGAIGLISLRKRTRRKQR